MIRRLLAVVVLLLLVGGAVYYWKFKPGTVGETREALGDVGATISNKIQATKVTASVKAALELHRDLAPLDIDVDGRDEGVVALQGEVPSDDLRLRAEQVASAVPDVAQVVNELRVNPSLGAAPADGRTLGESLDDRALEGKVKLAFSLHRGLKGTDIGVQSYRRQVTLSGQVGSPAQRQLALEVASRTPDVVGVTDRLAVSGQGAASSPAVPQGGPAPGGASPAAPGTPTSRAEEGADEHATAHGRARNDAAAAGHDRGRTYTRLDTL